MALDAHIQSEACLREQRGRILERNSCRNPWFGTVNARLSKAISIRGGRSVELSADVYNVLNLIKREWGQYRLTIPDPWVQLLRLRGYDTVNGRGIYEPFLRDVRAVQDLQSRWQVELGVRYVF